MRSRREYGKRRGLFIGIFVFLLLGIGLGYAIIETTLSINGNTTIVPPTWDIHFENVRITEGSRIPLSTDSEFANYLAPTINAKDKTQLNYKIILMEPGDYYEFIVDVVNAGSLPAKLTGVTNTELTDEEDVYTNYYVTYVDGTTPQKDEKLAVGGRKTLKVRIEFDQNIEPKDLPTERKSFDLTYKLNYVQDK